MTPRIFVGATSKDLISGRAIVTQALLMRDCMPVVQDQFPPDTRTIRAMLRRRIKDCDAVIHLVGECYGAEPRVREKGEPRRSYTQMEYDMARELKKPVYRFVCAPCFPYDFHAPEPADLRALQDQHRASLQAEDDIYYNFDDENDLKLRVRELEEPIEKLRRTSEKARRVRAAALCALATLLIGVSAFTVWRIDTQTKEVAAMRTQMNSLPAEVATRVVTAINRNLSSPPFPSPENPTTAAQTQVAKELGISVGEVRKQLAEQRTVSREMLARINQHSAAADVQAQQWHDLWREALNNCGNAEYASGHSASAIDFYRQALTLYDEAKEPLAWCETAQRLQGALAAQWQTAESLPLARRLVRVR